MPMYDYRCALGHRFERMLPLASYREPQECACGAPSRRLILPTLISVENVEYDCPITGKMITSKHAHEENLKLHDCRVHEPGETQGLKDRQARADADLDRKLDETVERQWESYSSDQKERLTNELLSGTDVTYERMAK